MFRVVVALALTLALVPNAGAAGREKMLFLGVTGGEGFTQKQLGTIEDLILGDLQKDARLEVVSKSDIATLVGVEAEKQALGCDEGSSCMTDLAGAVGAPLVARASVGKLGSNTVVALSVLDAEKAKQLARPTRTIYSDDELPDTLADLVTEATAKMRGEPYTPNQPAYARSGFSFDLLGNVGIDYDTDLIGNSRFFYGLDAHLYFGNIVVIPRVGFGAGGFTEGSSSTRISAEVGYLLDPRRLGLKLPKPAGLDVSLIVSTGPALWVLSNPSGVVPQWGARAVFLAEGEHVVLTAGIGSHIEAERHPIDIDLAAGWKF